MADELISREAAKEEILAWAVRIYDPKSLSTEDTMFVLDNLPSVDAVSRGVYEQIKWERDIAMEQLEEHGIAFGAKKQGDVVPVVCCGECAIPHNKWTGCPKLGGLVTPPDFYCAYGERKEGR